MIELRAECHKPPLAPERYSFYHINSYSLFKFSLIALTVSVYQAATKNNLDNAVYLLNSGKLLTLIESFVRHVNGLKCDDLTTNETEKLAQIDLVTNLAETLAGLLTVYNSIIQQNSEDQSTLSRLTDLIR